MKKSLKKAYEITDAKIQFVSFVDKAANKRQFLLKKEEGGKAAFTTYGRIVKADAENHYVTGIVYEPMAEDSHGNFMTEAEITKAAYWFAKNGDKVDLQHSFEPMDGAVVVENWIAKADFEINGEAIQKGTWLITVEVADEKVWEGIEKGEITGFSMGGLGNYSEEDIDLNKVSKRETGEKKGLLKQVAEALGLKVVEKGAVAELYEQQRTGDLFWRAFNALEEILRSYDPLSGSWHYETDENTVRECLEDFSKIITEILTGKESISKAIQTDQPIEKAGKKMSSKNKETLNNIYESLGAFLKEFDESDDDTEENKDETKNNKEEKEVTKQEVEQIVSATIAKAMGNNQQNTAEVVEKTKGDTAATEITQETIEKMVTAAIEKATQPQEEHITAEQVQGMITTAVEKAINPVLKSKGLPSNLNGDGSVEKSAGEEHYLHGIL